MIRFDDLADIVPEAFEWRVAAGLLLQLRKADLPARLAAAMLAGDFLNPAFEWAAQSEIVIRDRDDLSRFNRTHEPVRQYNLAMIEPEPLIVRSYKSTLFNEAKNACLYLSARPDVRCKRCPYKSLERLF